METWKLLLITLLSAVAIGGVGGLLVGKHQLKRKRPDYKPLLSTRERILYAASILVGAACIAIGLLYAGPGETAEVMAGMEGMDNMLEGDAAVDVFPGDDAAGSLPDGAGDIADDAVVNHDGAEAEGEAPPEADTRADGEESAAEADPSADVVEEEPERAEETAVAQG